VFIEVLVGATELVDAGYSVEESAEAWSTVPHKYKQNPMKVGIESVKPETRLAYKCSSPFLLTASSKENLVYHDLG
jgi:hypothetical protein